MGLTSFFTSLRPRRIDPDPPPLPLVQRMDTLEADVLALRGSLDSMAGTLRKLSGKIYRGVSLGDTVDSAPEAPQADHGGPPSKEDLYARAAALRSRH